MKKTLIAFMVAGLLALGGQAFAVMCAIDPVPAATLLLPYFEVDLNSAQGEGVNTTFSINNASAAPTIAHVTIWSDFSVPLIDFDVFLTGYDVQTISLANLFIEGASPGGDLPITADDARDPNDTISPAGTVYTFNPQWDGTFLGCDELPYPPGVLSGYLLERLRDGATGNDVAGEGCMGYNHGDGIARGYITIDDANICSIDFPSDPDYFTYEGNGIASNDNQLWGDYFIIDPVNNFAHGDTLVHIEAEDFYDFGPEFAETNYTFYGRYQVAQGDFGADQREPLGTTWAARYFNGGNFDGGTDLIVWRDSTNTEESGGAAPFFSCPGSGAGVDWFPLYQEQVVAFNEVEDAVELCDVGCQISPCGEGPISCFPLETQRTPVGVSPLSPPFNFGWLYLNLNIDDADTPFDVDFPFDDGVLAQSWVGVVHSALGRFSAGYSAVELTSACQNLNPFIVGDILEQ